MKGRLLILTGLLAIAGLIVTPAFAGAGANSGTETFQITQVNNGPGAVLAQGVFTASGINYPKTGSTDLFVFPDGAFSVHHPITSSTPTVNPTTCLFVESFSGSFTIKGGVGTYKGIAGSGTFSGTYTGVLPQNPNGTCDESRSAQPFSSVTSVSATGSVSYAAPK
jgi:hypothetical protein